MLTSFPAINIVITTIINKIHNKKGNSSRLYRNKMKKNEIHHKCFMQIFSSNVFVKKSKRATHLFLKLVSDIKRQINKVV